MTEQQNTPVPDSGLVDIRSIIRGSTDEACMEWYDWLKEQLPKGSIITFFLTRGDSGVFTANIPSEVKND